MGYGLTERQEKTIAPDFLSRKDRVGEYLKKLAEDFVFDEFQESFLKKEGLAELMKNVPVPLRHQDVVDFHGPKGLSLSHIVENMARIIGINPQFEFVPVYMDYIKHYYREQIVNALLKEGRDEAEQGQYQMAAVHFRGALAFAPDNMHVMYSYARVCRELYLAEEGGDPQYIGQFKAESIEYFELCTELFPTFAEPWYFLGYAYLNMGLYIKASLVWKEFLKYSKNGKDKKEIQERLEQLADPIKIEEGCNHILAGRWGQGLDVLLPYRESSFHTWWPLHYYLGVGFARIQETENAIGSFKKALTLSPSHEESMEELIQLYEKQENGEMVDKYRKKLAIVRED